MKNCTNWKKNTALFLSGQIISLFGSMLVQYAITWHITLETKSGMMMTISILCGFLPTLFISPFAGVWADRHNKKLLIILSDSVTALSTLALAILFMIGYNSIWLLFVAMAVRAVGAGIQTPSVGSFLPQLVPSDKLTRVNGINSSLQSAVALVSPLLSGALVKLAPLQTIFFIDVVTAAIAITILLVFLRVSMQVKAQEKGKTSYFKDMAEGLTYIKNHGFVKTIIGFCAVFYVFISPLAFLSSLQVTRSFGDDVLYLTAMEASFSLGMTIGGAVIASWGGFKNKLHTMVASNFLIAVSTFFLGIVPVFWIYLVLICFVGLSMPVFNTPLLVLLQQKVDGDFLGRVFGVFSMISSSFMPLSMLFYGPLADCIKIEWMLIATGLLMFVMSIFMSRNKVLMEAGKPIPEQAMPGIESNI